MYGYNIIRWIYINLDGGGGKGKNHVYTKIESFYILSKMKN